MGLLGGSFNPAHRGHLHVSVEALRRLGLDEVWWLVSPQNPLKTTDGMAPLAVRMKRARAVAQHPRIRVTDLERHLRTRFSVDTVAALQRRFPRIRFVWLMGADIMIQMPRWQRWPQLFASIPVAVFARPDYVFRAMAGKVAHRYRQARVSVSDARHLADYQPPAWTFIPIPLDSTSATEIRARLSSWPPPHRRKTAIFGFDAAAERMEQHPTDGPRPEANPEDARPDEGQVVNGAEGADLLPLILKRLDDDQAQDVVTIDLRGKSSICDHMIVASGRAQRHVAAMAEHLAEDLKPLLGHVPAIEGMPAGDWVLIDGGDVIVHLFRPEVRSFYNLEKMWGIELPEPRPFGAPPAGSVGDGSF